MPPKRCVIGRVSWRLVVNADAGAGSLAVEVLAENGTPLQGYGADDCAPLRADAVRHAVTWGVRDRLPAERPVRLRFRLRDAGLYSYRLLE